MDESAFIDWYDVAEAIANGRLTGHVCPMCGHTPLDVTMRGSRAHVRCPSCGQGLEGQVGHGRDDALYAQVERQEARARRAAAPQTEGVCAPLDDGLRVTTSAQGPGRAGEPRSFEPQTARRPDRWEWRLPSTAQADQASAGYATWSQTVESIYNGRRAGLSCPYCSEPLSNIEADDTHIRVWCDVCGEGFEGRFG